MLMNDARSSVASLPVTECANDINNGNYWNCARILALSVWKLHDWNENTPVKVCGIPCTGNLKGRISKWQWKWDARFRCDTKAPGTVGVDTKSTKKKAMEGAIQDFFHKAISSGYINVDDVCF